MDTNKSLYLAPDTITVKKRPSDNAIQQRATIRGAAVTVDEVIEAGNPSSSEDKGLENLQERMRNGCTKTLEQVAKNPSTHGVPVASAKHMENP
jgi:hypothetical protein